MMSNDNKKILIVDDSPTVRRLVELVLAQHGYQVFSAEDGESGLGLARQHLPAVVLVDFVMPRMNGHMFCKALREDESLKDTPVILISSKSEVVGQAFEESFGIVHYFTKPFEPEDLLDKINEVLAEAQTEPAPAGDGTSSTNGSGISSLGGSEIDELLESINERFDKVVRRYFQKDFPVLMKNVLSDTLKETGVVKHQTLIMSGDLSRVSLAQVLRFCANSRQCGRLSVFSDETFAEIFIDNGRFVFATASQKGKHNFLTDLIQQDKRFTHNRVQLQEVVKEARDKNVPIGRALVAHGLITEDELMVYLRQHAQEAFNAALSVNQGNFFLEKDDLPFNLDDITFRIPMYELLLVGVRTLTVPATFIQRDMVFQRLPVSMDVLDAGLLTEKEETALRLFDGSRDFTELSQQGVLNNEQLSAACYVLYLSGVATIR